jgi:transcriptional regulator with XRE-family HTH domain
MDIKQKLGAIIKKCRKNKSFSQERLALLSNIDRTYICDVEKGERNISVDVLEKLANALEIPISELFAQAEKYKE